MKQKRIIILILTIVTGLGCIQARDKEFVRGYIITNTGDTLRGYVMDRKEGSFPELYSKIRFRPEDSRRVSKYGPAQIQGYACGNQGFESVPLHEDAEFFMFRYYVDANYEDVFLKVVASHEKLVLYHREYTDDESGYIDYLPLFHKPGTGEMVRVTQGVLGLKRKQLSDYFRGCPELSSAIENREVNTALEVFNYYVNNCLQ